MKKKPTQHPVRKPLTVGWREYVDLPEWGISGLLAKSDTGARSSAIDVESVEELPDNRVAFHVVLDRKDRSKTRRIEADLIGHTRVKSSNGRVQERFKVRTLMRLGHIEKPVEFSLVNRKRMLCRVLLGRRALAGDFLVDSQIKFHFGPRSVRKKQNAPGKPQ